jgi:Flp pilus assembly secretin CpaC
MRKELLRRHARVCLLVAAAVLASPAASLAEATADTIAVSVDQAKLVRLPGKVATIVVGNPLIADVTLQPGGMIVVTGKGYGATNFIALDRGGEILVDRQIQVEGPSDRLVTVYRGVERESYSCMPLCQRRVTLGDSDNYFNNTMSQAGSLSNNASGNAGAAAKTNSQDELARRTGKTDASSSCVYDSADAAGTTC